jgi:hypothetical protein
MSKQAPARRKTDRTSRHERLQIPRRFQLHGHQLTVRILPRTRWPHPKDTVGMYDPTCHRIDLRGDQGDTELQQTFCHEWAHALLDEMNHPLSHDEVFVDNLASLLHQSLTTFDSGAKPCR